MVLGAEVHQQQRTSARQRLDQVGEERLAAAVDPVEVLDQEHLRLVTAPGVKHPPHRREELALAGRAAHLARRAVGVGDAEELEHERQARLERLVEQQQPARDLLARGLIRVLRADAEVAPQQLQDRQERDHPAVRERVRLVHGDPAREAASGELEAQPTLADAGLAHHADDLSVPLERPLERGIDAGRLRVAADEAGEAARARDLQPGAQRADALERADPRRLARCPSP